MIEAYVLYTYKKWKMCGFMVDFFPHYSIDTRLTAHAIPRRAQVCCCSFFRNHVLCICVCCEYMLVCDSFSMNSDCVPCPAVAHSATSACAAAVAACVGVADDVGAAGPAVAGAAAAGAAAAAAVAASESGAVGVDVHAAAADDVLVLLLLLVLLMLLVPVAVLLL